MAMTAWGGDENVENHAMRFDDVSRFDVQKPFERIQSATRTSRPAVSRKESWARKQVGTFSVFEDTVTKDSARERAELTAELERCHSLLQLVAAEDEKQVSSPTPFDSLWFNKTCAYHRHELYIHSIYAAG